MFKKIVAAIATITTREDIENICEMIDAAAINEQITWKERDMLDTIVGKINIDQ